MEGIGKVAPNGVAIETHQESAKMPAEVSGAALMSSYAVLALP